MIDLSERTILITGASSGIGRQTAITCAKLGAKLILSGRNSERLQESLDQLAGTEHLKIECDLTHENQIETLIDNLPSLDGIVHSSGSVNPIPAKFITQEKIDEVSSINFQAPILLSSRLLKRKKINRGASIVFMSSISARFAYKGGALYSAAKAGLNAYSKTIAIEHAPQRIRSNSIEAAMVQTRIFDETEKAVGKEQMAKHGERYPLGFGKPQDVANAIAFLLSDASKWITGTTLTLDGGLTAGR